MISSILFLALLGFASFYFYKQLQIVKANINLGKPTELNLNSTESWSKVINIAFGQKKMFKITIPALLHMVVYVGFILINIEVLEIVIDGIFGTHRVLSFLGPVYDLAIGFFEILALGVLVACVVFLIRRYVLKINRFQSTDLAGFANRDAATILFVEIILMAALLKMNAADQILQSRNVEHYIQAGSFPISSWLIVPIFNMFNYSDSALILVERIAWWFHIIGILAFLNYLPKSKHFHIIMAFPNVFYSKQEAVGKMNTIESVKHEVSAMLDPSYQVPATTGEPGKFGAKDVTDLSWKNLLDSYSCTECGRCTASCPANITGKKLSPRKIVMSVKDRLENINGGSVNENVLLDNYITPEELWACTSCNACVEACPVTIDPLSTILEMRRYIVLEQSAAPSSINAMFTNIENNGAPWAFSASDRLNWANDLFLTVKN
jgi:heterodisulfide reductase subunit C